MTKQPAPPAPEPAHAHAHARICTKTITRVLPASSHACACRGLVKWEPRGRDPYSRFIAAAACRQLGFEAGVLKLQAGTVYGSVASPIWALELGCDYYHSRLADCDVFANK